MALSQKDIDAAVDTVIGEAEGEGAQGWAAVAGVLKNRAVSTGKSILKLVSAPEQFDGYLKPGASAKKARENKAFRAKVEAVVRGVFDGTVDSGVGNSDHFYATKTARPYWADSFTPAGKIGGHSFFSSGKVSANQQRLTLLDPAAPVPAAMSAKIAAARKAGGGTAVAAANAMAGVPAPTNNFGYLPASSEDLALRPVAPIPATMSARIAAARKAGSGALRPATPVTTIPIDPNTGLPTTAAGAEAAKADFRQRIAAAAGTGSSGIPTGQLSPPAVVQYNPATRAGTPPPAGVYPGSDAYKQWEARLVQSGGVPQYIVRTPPAITPAITPGSVKVKTVTVRRDGTTSTSDVPGSVAMPAGAKPRLKPLDPASVPSWVPFSPYQDLATRAKIIKQQPTAFTPTTRSVRSTNPAYTLYMQQLGANQRMTPTGSVVTADQFRAMNDPNYVPPKAPEGPPPQFIEKTVSNPVSPGAPRPGGSFSYEPPKPAMATIKTGKTVPVGTTYQQGSSGSGTPYTYQVQSDGSIKNTTTGRITSPPTAGLRVR